MLYNAVFVSAVQQSESAVHSRVPSLWTSFLFRSPAGIKPSPGHAVCSHQASVSRAASVICMCWPCLPIRPCHPLGVHTPVLCACVSFCSAHKILSTTFLDSTYALIAKPVTITPNSALSVQPHHVKIPGNQKVVHRERRLGRSFEQKARRSDD